MMAPGAHKPGHHRQLTAQQQLPGGQQPHGCDVVSRLLAPFAVLLLLAALLAYLALSHAQPPPPALLLASTSRPPPAVSRRDEEAGGTMRFDGAARVVRLAVGVREGGGGGGDGKGADARQDARGWMIDPLAAAVAAGLKGGATSCLMTHVGEVLPEKIRGNHRHHDYNETLVLWGARMRVRNENRDVAKGFAEVILTADDVAVMACPAMSAHAVVNIDTSRSAYLMACQDGLHDPNDPRSDYAVWSDLV
ncbi:unnamed protein product [Closterium sp. Yama58-4]|nr:unnamed protein product [Closterium sp. Yama58-4]